MHRLYDIRSLAVPLVGLNPDPGGYGGQVHKPPRSMERLNSLQKEKESRLKGKRPGKMARRFFMKIPPLIDSENICGMNPYLQREKGHAEMKSFQEENALIANHHFLLSTSVVYVYPFNILKFTAVLFPEVHFHEKKGT